jgi:2-polyprenyl-3-methyl-5-hydroxy-6-metoxy-1,4-benzoquinol methylase
MTEPAAPVRRRGDSIAIEGSYQDRARREGFVVQRFWHAEKERIIRDHAAPAPGERVLDVGCGSGVVADVLASLGADVTGIDSNPAAIAYARGAYSRPNLRVEETTVDDLALEPDSVDRIYCLELIEHLDEPQGADLLAGFRRALRPGGTLFLTTPNYRGTWPVLETLMDRLRLAPPLAGHQHVSRFTRRLLRRRLADAGFAVVRLGTFCTVAPFLSVLSWRAAERLARAEDRWNLPWGNLFLAIAEKRPA